MRRLSGLALMATLPLAVAQNKPPKDFKEYCWQNPKAQSCKDFGFTEHSRAIERGFENRTEVLERLNQPRGTPGVIQNPGYRDPSYNRSTLSRPGVGSAAPAMVVMSVPDWRFAHPDTGLLMSIKLQSILESPLAPMILGQIYGQLQTSGMPPEQIDQFRNAIREIDQISISMRPPAPGTPPDALVLLSGRFDKMARLLYGKAQKLQSGGGLLIGPPNSMAAAVRRTGEASVAAWSPLFTNVKELEEESDIWIAGAGALVSTPEVKKALGANASLVSGVRNFALGVGMRDGFSVNLTLQTTTPVVADKMLTAFRQLESQMKVKPSDMAQIDKLESGLRFRAKASANDPGVAQMAAAMGIPWSPPAAASQAGTEAPKRKGIVIDGLGGNPTEASGQKP